jgi:hypothetical protein
MCMLDVIGVSSGHEFNLVCGVAMYRNNISN